jgi:hypothetical protein
VKIKRWLRDGIEGLAKDCCDTNDLLDRAGRALDALACSHDLMGEILFEGEDGVIYTGDVEFIISKATPAYVEAVMDGDPPVEDDSAVSDDLSEDGSEGLDPDDWEE